jgi:hypothetical protein
MQCTCSCPHCCWQRTYGHYTQYYGAYQRYNYSPANFLPGNDFVNPTDQPEPEETENNLPNFVAPELVYLLARSGKRSKAKAKAKTRTQTKLGIKSTSEPKSKLQAYGRHKSKIHEAFQTNSLYTNTRPKEDLYGDYAHTIQALESQLDSNFDQQHTENHKVWPQLPLTDNHS